MASLVESSIFSLESMGFKVLYWRIDRGQVEVILEAPEGEGDFTNALSKMRRDLKARRVALEVSREGRELLVRMSFELGEPPKGLKPRGLNDLLAWGPTL